ncbi:unnamed protein product [Kuraishia capsulata CBS 1993]|uniref:mRNA-capping enzyme subunit beta n=1 Tax=Kuraishia capsulata CBS 1993 TaxID=1382522 RepID=W6MJA0_9ASCO|nr:uncharacterized protein KUCA_T00002307001 [Kuraishia capsulata CBS 1993]CDK26336.1 unnamed protein product [Kuraishia capsulata CBS 1993]
MDLRNLIDDDDAAGSANGSTGRTSSPASVASVPKQEPHRFSIDSMMNNEPAFPDERALEIRKRNSIVNLTNAQDVDFDGHAAPRIARSSSTATLDVSPTAKGFAVPQVHPQIHGNINMSPLVKSVSPNTRPVVPKAVTLDEELKSLGPVGDNEKENLGKPRRYKTKPKWAQDYVPTMKAHKSQSLVRPVNSSLEALSITNSIPYDDFIMSVTKWIYANIAKIREDNPDEPNIANMIELELKVGQLWDEKEDRKLRLPVLSETPISKEFYNERCSFRSGITPEQYRDAKEFLGKLADSNTKNDRKFIVQKIHEIDKSAVEAVRNSKPVNVRVSFDYNTKRFSSSIHKEKLSDMFLYFPNSLFDLRLTMALERPVNLNPEALEAFTRKVTLEREKDRLSYFHNATFTRIDLTKIKQTQNSKQIRKHELELEINTPELLRAIEILPKDSLYYVDLVKTFLDNGRVLARKLSEGPLI